MEKETKRNLIIIGIFAAAMAFVEAMIVFYLRKLYYSGDVLFIMTSVIPAEVIKLEWIREIATIVMLLAVAFLAARKFKDKFAYFIYAFAIWDIFYYVWLKLILNWPAHLAELDVLFLIPTIWVSPWVAPVIISIIMIILALIIISFPKERIKLKEWVMLLVSAIVFFGSFVWNYAPIKYNWWLFAIGVLFTGLAICSFLKRAKKIGGRAR